MSMSTKTAQEKQALIRSHAAKRHEHPPGSKLPIYIGIVVCAVIVAGGWALTLPRAFANRNAPADAAIRTVSDNLSVFKK